MRRDARVVAFEAIVSFLFASEPEIEQLYQPLKKEEDVSFAKGIVGAFISNREEISSLIDKHLVGYEMSRVYKLDLAILYLALSEILYIKTPYQVAINEAVEIAKKYSTAKSASFINGVLSSIIKDLK